MKKQGISREKAEEQARKHVRLFVGGKISDLRRPRRPPTRVNYLNFLIKFLLVNFCISKNNCMSYRMKDQIVLQQINKG